MKLNKTKIEYIIRKRKHGMSTYQISKNMKVSERRVNQILELYRKTGEMPVVGKNVGRPKKPIYSYERESIIECFREFKISASLLRILIKNKYSIDINHNRIHKVLLEEGLAKPIGKKVKRKTWVRYERRHSLSAVHMDWMYDHKIGKWVIAVIDDASRKILAYGEFSHATVENTILVLKEALKYGKIREVITDRGPQFTANKTDKKGRARSQFAEFCKAHGIKQILCRIKHPQSNGKIERWFGTYRQKRHMFPSLKEFVYWYNNIKPHLSLDFDKLETPSQAFIRKFKK